MDERFLLKLALFTTIASLAILLVIVKNIQMQENSITDAKLSGEGEKLRISGVVESISAKEGFSVLKIKKEEEISVVAFENITLKKGDWIILEGTVKDYQGEKEIVAEKIIKQ